MNQPETPKYATLFYHIREQLGVTWSEYVLLEMVYHLSHKTGYCYKTPGYIAKDLGFTKQGVNRLIRSLIKKGLMERLSDFTLRVTDRYYTIQTLGGNKVSDRGVGGNKVTKVETKLTDRKQSTPKNNNENNKEYKKAREASAKLRASLTFLNKPPKNQA